MYKGYEIVSKGYSAVKIYQKAILVYMKLFLDKLLQVSPVIKEYKRVADIINCQQKILSGYTSAFSNFKSDGNFTAEEIGYLENVYSNLLMRVWIT